MRATDPTLDGSPTSAVKPVSPRKLAANCANAARSTGPRSDAGKARSSTNALRHGLAARAALLPGEDAAELELLAGEFEADLKPIGATERELVGRVISLAWRLRRVTRAEEALWDADDAEATRRFKVSAGLREQFGFPQWPGDATEPPAPKPGAAFVAAQFEIRGTSPLERLAVYEQRLGRALHAALRQLQQLRKMKDARGEAEAKDAAPAGDQVGESADIEARGAELAIAADPVLQHPPVQNEATGGVVSAVANAHAAFPADVTPQAHAVSPVQNEPTAGGHPAYTDSGGSTASDTHEHAGAQNEPTAAGAPAGRRGT